MFGHFSWPASLPAPPRSGKHSYTFPNGNSYTGDFEDGLPHGQGSIAFPSGNRCV